MFSEDTSRIWYKEIEQTLVEKDLQLSAPLFYFAVHL